MRASTAAKLVSGFVNKTWPDDQEDLFEILELAVNKAWNEGKWLGMTQHIFVKTHRDALGRAYIIAPYSHPILLAINVDGKPTAIRGAHFMFHKNGMGDVKDGDGCRWNQDVYDLGAVPTLDDGSLISKDGFLVGVRAIGVPGEDEKVFINGTHTDNTKVYTFQNSADIPSSCACEVKPETVETVHGISIDIRKGFHYLCNVRFSEVLSITKTNTRTPIEILAIRPDNTVFVLARMEPNQTESSYRKYVIPDNLCRDYVHGLFKIRKQEPITSHTQEIIIDDKEVLISLCKGIYNLLYKDQLEMGAGFINLGIGTLEKSKREQESPDQFPIQVDPILSSDIPNSFNYYS